MTSSTVLLCVCRQRRRDELVQVQQAISEEFANSLVGQEIDVLVDGVNEDGWLFGRTQYDAPGQLWVGINTHVLSKIAQHRV